jgi:hypothetical protein
VIYRIAAISTGRTKAKVAISAINATNGRGFNNYNGAHGSRNTWASAVKIRRSACVTGRADNQFSARQVGTRSVNQAPQCKKKEWPLKPAMKQTAAFNYTLADKLVARAGELRASDNLFVAGNPE